MSDVKSLQPDLDRLDAQIDGIEDALQPLLRTLEKPSQLPLLDKAKLFSLTAYTIETLLFSSLKLQNVNAQEHAVFTELKRIQQKFAKIKAAEAPQEERKTTVNQEAAARILKADLGSNSKTLSSKLAEKIAEERAKALLKSMEASKAANKKRPAEDSPGLSASAAADGSKGGKQKKQKHKHRGKKH
uniref:Exosome complex protein n=1 Tax=Bionectria ochroleuca TaxID=29856 RepID=A0A8H7TV06_BIOOC